MFSLTLVSWYFESSTTFSFSFFWTSYSIIKRAILIYFTLHNETHSLPIAKTNKCTSRVRKVTASILLRVSQQSFPFIHRQCAKLSSWTARWVSLARCICSAVLAAGKLGNLFPGKIRAFEFLAGWRLELSFFLMMAADRRLPRSLNRL